MSLLVWYYSECICTNCR